MNESFDYSGSAGAVYHGHRRLPPQAEEWVAHVRAAKLQPFINKNDSVFEYGLGFGWNLMALDCAEKAGYDVAPGLRSIVESRGIHFIEAPEKLSSESFDAVICHHTLEHLVNPAEALQVIFRLLKPGGKLLLFTPYEIERKYRRPNPNDRAHHLYSWTPATLANLVQSQSFCLESVRLRRFRFDRIAAVAALKFHVGEPGYRLIRRLGLFLLPEYEIALLATRS